MAATVTRARLYRSGHGPSWLLFFGAYASGFLPDLVGETVVTKDADKRADFLRKLNDFLGAGNMAPDRRQLFLEAAEKILTDSTDKEEPLVSRAHVEDAADLQTSLYGERALEMAQLAEKHGGGKTFARLVRVELERRKRMADRD